MSMDKFISPIHLREHGLALGNARYGLRNQDPMCKQCEKSAAVKEGYCSGCFRELSRNNDADCSSCGHQATQHDPWKCSVRGCGCQELKNASEKCANCRHSQGMHDPDCSIDDCSCQKYIKP